MRDSRDFIALMGVVNECREKCCSELRVPCPIIPDAVRRRWEKCVEECVATAETGSEVVVIE